jgi:hypothetical protein
MFSIGIFRCPSKAKNKNAKAQQPGRHYNPKAWIIQPAFFTRVRYEAAQTCMASRRATYNAFTTG